MGGTATRGFSDLAGALATGALSAASAFDIGPGFTPARASARMLPVSLGAADLAAATGAAFGAGLTAGAGFAAGAGFGDSLATGAAAGLAAAAFGAAAPPAFSP